MNWVYPQNTGRLRKDEARVAKFAIWWERIKRTYPPEQWRTILRFGEPK